MRASYDTYKDVAENCSEFMPIHEVDSYSSSTKEKEDNVSCTNCKHFDDDKYCELDLFDKIVK